MQGVHFPLPVSRFPSLAMIPDPSDTIVALSSAPGPGGRAIIRLSGSQALPTAATVFSSTTPLLPDRRCCYPGTVRIPDLGQSLPADLYVWPAPRTYTGQD